MEKVSKKGLPGFDMSVAQVTYHNDVVVCPVCPGGEPQGVTVAIAPNRTSFWKCKKCEGLFQYEPSLSAVND